jgi:mannose/fructose-specific phosphotransferase system component IIA
MTKVVVLGHGGYGSAMRRNIEMLAGVQEDYYYVDFNEEEDQEILKAKIDAVLQQVGDHDVLFCCDLVGGTPFNVSTAICAEKSNYCCVGGLNTMAYLSMQYELESSAFELADMACGVAKEAVMRFPPVEE